MTKYFILFVSILFFFTISHASGHISGKVIDAETDEPLPGANIQILGTLTGTSTDSEGNFTIENPDTGSLTIRISMIGYRTKTIDVSEEQGRELRIILEETPIEFDPIIVSAGKIKQRLDLSPVSMSVITSRDIKKRNPANLIEALESVPGIHFIGNQINIRGSTGYTFGAGNKVLLLLDGVPVYASDTGEFNWDMLPPLDIEQIEVLKGAGSTLWGASALGGVVNIITKSPTPEGKILFSLNAGKYDEPLYKEWFWTDHNRLYYLRNDISLGKQIGKAGLRISAGYFKSSGYRQLGDFSKCNLTGKFDYKLSNSMKWTSYAAYSYMDQGFFVQWKGQNDPYEVDETNLDNYAELNQFNLYTKLAFTLSEKLGMNFRASMVRTVMGSQFGESGDFNPAFGQGLELQTNWIPGSGHIFTFGVQYQHDSGSSKYFGDHKGYFIGSYLQDEWKIRDNLRVTAGFRYDRYQLIGGLKEDLLSPRIGINWKPWPMTSLRASAGSGFRAATIVERFIELSIMNFNIIANQELKAESSRAFDLGIRHYLSRNWNIDISLFDNEYWDMIEAHLDLIRGQIQFRNLTRARVQGIEAASNFSRSIRFLGLKVTYNLSAGITAMQHENLKWHEPLSYRPKLLATIKNALSAGPVELQIDYRYASQIDEVKIYPINDRVPMKFLDLRLSCHIRMLTFQLGVNNLSQFNYAPMESNLMPMRTFTAGLQGEL